MKTKFYVSRYNNNFPILIVLILKSIPLCYTTSVNFKNYPLQKLTLVEKASLSVQEKLKNRSTSVSNLFCNSNKFVYTN